MFPSMKSVLVCGALAVAVAAQSINIAMPAALTTMKAGDSITVQVEKPDSLTGSTEVGIALSLQSCSGHPGGCDAIDVSQVLGTTLLISQWGPTYHSDQWYPYQNFTVTIPETFESGQAVLSATHLVLVGAGPFPSLEVVNQTIAIA